MKVSSLAVLLILGVADAASISGETIQHHMNKLDKFRLMKHSHRVAKGRKLDDSSNQAYGSNTNSYQYDNYDSSSSSNGNSYGTYASSSGSNSGGSNQNSGSSSYQQNNNNNNNNGNNEDNEYYTQDVNKYYFQNMRQGDFVIDGTKTIEFEQCVSLRSLNEDITQYEGKNMQSISDFVIFKVTDKYQKEFEFAVGISDFVESLISTIPDDRENYCQVCQQSFETCQEQKSQNEWNSVFQNSGNIGSYYGFNNKQKENKESNMANWGWEDSEGMSYYAQDYYAQNDDYAQSSNSNGNYRRKLDQQDDYSIEYIDCETCDSFGCFDQLYEQQKSSSSSSGSSNLYSQSAYRSYNNQDDQYTQYTDDQYTQSYAQRNYGNYQQQQQQQVEQQFSTPMQAALNWVSEVAQCKELKMFDSSGSRNYYTNYKSNKQAQQSSDQYYGYDKKYNDETQNQQTSSTNYGANSYKSSIRNPYAGMMCNSDGTGMEVGIFMDQYCSIYDSSRTYKDIIKYGSPQSAYYELTKGLMEFTFTQPIECKANEYAEPDFDSRADYEYYRQQQQQQQEAANQYYGNAEEFYNAYNEQQDESYQQTNEYYQDQSDAYYSYYMDGSDVQAADSCQQLFQQQVVQLGIPCNDNDQQQYNQDQQSDQAFKQYYSNQDKPYGEYSYFSAYSGRQSYAYEIQNPSDQKEVCTVMNSKKANNSFQKNAMSQSRFKNLYNYKLYSVTTNWRGFRTRIGEGFQTFRYNAGERFRSIHEEEISTKFAIVSFLIVASMGIVYAISRCSAPYVAKGLTTAASHAVEHAERLAEHVKSMRDDDSSYGHTLTQESTHQFSEIESFDFYDETQNEPSGKKHRLFY